MCNKHESFAPMCKRMEFTIKKSKGGGQEGGGGRREERGGVLGLGGFKKAACPSQRALILGLA